MCPGRFPRRVSLALGLPPHDDLLRPARGSISQPISPLVVFGPVVTPDPSPSYVASFGCPFKALPEVSVHRALRACQSISSDFVHALVGRASAVSLVK